jgi:serine/threonine protein kinase
MQLPGWMQLLLATTAVSLQLCENDVFEPIERDLGTGTQGEVSVQRSWQDGRLFVKKVIPRSDGESEEGQWHAFTAEVTILEHLQGVQFVPQLHCVSDFPNMTLPEYEEKAGGVYFLMEYVPWQDAEHYLAEHDDPEALRRVVKQAARALQAIHDRGVLHLDVKPANLLTNGQEVKLIDFGGAMAPSVGIVESDYVHHTDDYMAPEKENYTPAFDWYSLGASAYFGRAIQIMHDTDYEPYYPMRLTRLPKDETDLIHFIETCTVHNAVDRVPEGFMSLSYEPYFQSE